MKSGGPRACELQLALDQVSLGDAERVVSAIGSNLRRVEIGTPLILTEGFRAFERIRRLIPGPATVVADVKICDAGATIAAAAYGSGADVVTVVAAAIDDPTWDGVLSFAQGDGPSGSARRVMIDLIGTHGEPTMVSPWLARARDAGVPVELCVHRPKSNPSPFPQLFDAIRPYGRSSVSTLVAGSLRVGDVTDAVHAGFDILIIGGAVTAASDPARAWSLFQTQKSG